jgi:hypothetical protein
LAPQATKHPSFATVRGRRASTSDMSSLLEPSPGSHGPSPLALRRDDLVTVVTPKELPRARSMTHYSNVSSHSDFVTTTRADQTPPPADQFHTPPRETGNHGQQTRNEKSLKERYFRKACFVVVIIVLMFLVRICSWSLFFAMFIPAVWATHLWEFSLSSTTTPPPTIPNMSKYPGIISP